MNPITAARTDGFLLIRSYSSFPTAASLVDELSWLALWRQGATMISDLTSRSHHCLRVNSTYKTITEETKLFDWPAKTRARYSDDKEDTERREPRGHRASDRVYVPRASRCPNWKLATSAPGFIFKQRRVADDYDDHVDATSFFGKNKERDGGREKEREREEYGEGGNKGGDRTKNTAPKRKTSRALRGENICGEIYVCVADLFLQFLWNKYTLQTLFSFQSTVEFANNGVNKCSRGKLGRRGRRNR